VMRVATFYVADAPGPLCPYGGTYYRDGDFGTSDIHDLTHRVNGRDPLADHVDARAVIFQQMLRMNEVVGSLADRLAAAIEPDGSTLLDHTLIVYVSQIGSGNHTLRNLPWYMVGSCQGYFQTGRYIRSSTERAHNDLMVSVANAMGVPLTVFGDPSVCTGPLAGL